MRNDLLKLKNIGAKFADRLLKVEIESREQLEELGAVTAFRRLRRAYPASQATLWEPSGAQLGLPYYEIPPAINAAQRDELELD